MLPQWFDFYMKYFVPNDKTGSLIILPPGSFIIKEGESVPRVPVVSFCCRFGVTLSCTLEFSYFFSLPQCTFTSHSSLLESSLLLWAPWEHLWLPCCPGGSRDSAVWSLRSTLGLSGNSTGPLKPPRLHALKPIQPPPPFLLLLFFFSLCCPLLPWVIGVRQTCCVQVRAFVHVQMNRWMHV